MKIAYEDFATVINTSNKNITSLVIEDARTLYRFLTAVKMAILGLDSNIIISKNDTPVNMTKEVILLSDFVNFDINQKHLLTKIIGELSDISVNERFYELTQNLLAQTEDHIMNIAMDLPCEIVFDKLNIQSILKGIGVSILDDYDSLEERILAYMELVRTLEGERLFILANARCFISQERFELMVNDILLKEYEILFVDCMEYPKVEGENRLVIDKDLCEI